MHAETGSVAQLLGAATARIAASLGLDTRDARLDARVLAAHAWHVTSAWLIAHDRDTPDADAAARYRQLVERRAAGAPVAYLVGMREFHGRPFHVTPDVLIPRPDTELLVERALAALPPETAADLLDLGTGSGCIAITLALERPGARIVAVDRSPAALAIAARNAAALGARVELLESDWFAALAGRRFDIIVSNPPYVAATDPHLARGDVRFEPASALAAGPAGLDDLRRLVTHAPEYLHPGGRMLLEHGFDQAPAVRAMLEARGFRQVCSWNDLAGIPRVSGGRLSE